MEDAINIETDRIKPNKKESSQMKIAIPIDGNNLDSMINNSFGRTKKFIIVDDSNMISEIIDNEQNLQASQGAGIQSAQNVVKSGVEVVITLHCGPKAFKVLSGSEVKVCFGQKGTIKENVEAFKENRLEKMESANMESHWV